MPGKSTVVYHWHGCMVHTYDKIHGYPTCYVLRAESKRVPMHSPWALRLAVTVLAAAAGGVAHADIYSFVDGAGVTHFSNVPVDNRYRLLLATPVEEDRKSTRLNSSHGYISYAVFCFEKQTSQRTVATGLPADHH